MNWFVVVKEGLAKLLQKRGKSFAILELIQNCWDQNDRILRLALELVPNRALARLVVEDDDPRGFDDLSHAYTLFAESAKKSHPTKRGRFNLGEKLVLALCEEAIIASTTGTVVFDREGRHSYPRRKRERGSQFSSLIRMTRAEYEEVVLAVGSLIPPEGIVTIFNGEELMHRPPVAEFTAQLPTEVAGDDGVLRKTTRRTTVGVYEVPPGEQASIYEMGIPVVETGDRWHVNIGQKVPLNLDRDNVPPAYLRTLRTLTFKEMHKHLAPGEVNAAWVREATSDERVSDDAVTAALTHRFGERRVIYDPSDPEANKIAVSQGYTVIAGNALNKQEWNNVRRAGAALPAGQVTPSPKPFHPDREPLELLPEEQYTEGTRRITA